MKTRWCWVFAVVMLACGGGAERVGPPGPVIVRTDPASVADCPYGGSVVGTGIDTNGDGTLQDAEVETRTPACQPAPMLPPQIVVRLIAEPTGAHCSAGGTAVQSGTDRNRNGQLDDDEVSDVDYLCREALLTRFAAQPPGPSCLAGGTVFFAGRDRDGDGILQDSEVETTELECGDVLSRDVAIRSTADVAALANIRIITGTLLVQLTSLRTISLPRLEHVGGALKVLDNLQLNQLALPALQDVDGDFALKAGKLTMVQCPQLRRVGAFELELISLPDLGGFPALTEVDRDVRITSTVALVAADLSLSSIGGEVSITGNDALVHIAWRLSGHLRSIAISNNPRLDTLDLSVTSPQETTTVGPIALSSNAKLAHIALHADRVRSLSIAHDPVITDISLAVDEFEGDVSILDVTVPFTLALDSSRFGEIELGGRLTISGPLKSLRSETFVFAHGLCVFDQTLLRTLDDGVYDWTMVEGLQLSNNTRLTGGTEIRLIGSLQVINNALLQDLSFVSLPLADQIGAVVITDNPLLASAPSLAQLTRVHGAVDVERNPKLRSLFGPPLIRIEGPVSFIENASLASLQFPNLLLVGSDVEVSSNAALQTLEMPSLTEAADQLFIVSNPQLHHIDLSTLAHSEDFQVVDNPQLPTCEVLAAFAHTTGAHAQSGNDDTASCTP